MQDGVAVMLGVAAACEVTVSHEVAIVPAIAYGVACALSVAAETAKSVSHVMHSRLHILAGHADRTTLFSTAVFCGPVVYMAGAFLATRLYQHASRSERGDCKPLLSKPSPEFCPETKGLTDEGAPSLWPPAPRRPPLPLYGSAEPRDGAPPPPFQAIFATPLPSSMRSQMGQRVPRQSRSPPMSPEEPGAVL